jgi:hypothetical protein
LNWLTVRTNCENEQVYFTAPPLSPARKGRFGETNRQKKKKDNLTGQFPKRLIYFMIDRVEEGNFAKFGFKSGLETDRYL